MYYFFDKGNTQQVTEEMFLEVAQLRTKDGLLLKHLGANIKKKLMHSIIRIEHPYMSIMDTKKMLIM